MKESEISIIFEDWIESELMASAAGYPNCLDDLAIYVIIEMAQRNFSYMEYILKHHGVIV